MKIPLNEGDALIRTMLLEQWHLEVIGIHFIPIGDSAYSYRAGSQPNNSYYLKVVEPLDEVQRDNDVTMIEYHCLNRLESVERTATKLNAGQAA